MIAWGGASPRWVRNQLLLLRKIAWKRERPLKAVALVLAPPADKEPLQLGLPHLITIDCSSGFDPAALAPFHAALERPA